MERTKDTSVDHSLGPIEARLRLAAIVDSSEDAILSKDLDGVITSWNTAATKLFGYLPEEIIGKSVLTLIPPELHGEEPEILRRVSAGESIEHFETRRLSKSGELIDISLTISPIRDASGTIVGISKIVRNITDRRRTEEALVRSERLAAIGRMAATISHEVNNPLEAILNLGYILAHHPSLDAEARGYADTLVEEVVRVSEITKRTLSFYRDTTDPTEVEMKPLIEGVLRLNDIAVRHKSIHVRTRLAPSVRMWGRPGELRQVFINLVVNALDALPSSGTLTVRVSAKEAGASVCVTIADDGSGIPRAIRERLFEPFFSTKQAKGTGLGLWVCSSIVKKYHGSISIRTSDVPGRSGTVIRVCLPSRGQADIIG